MFLQKTIPKRIVIYAKDIENITGRKERTARKLLADMRVYFKKKRGDFITIDEFCLYTGIKAELVEPFLVG